MFVRVETESSVTIPPPLPIVVPRTCVALRTSTPLILNTLPDGRLICSLTSNPLEAPQAIVLSVAPLIVIPPPAAVASVAPPAVKLAAVADPVPPNDALSVAVSPVKPVTDTVPESVTVPLPPEIATTTPGAIFVVSLMFVI